MVVQNSRILFTFLLFLSALLPFAKPLSFNFSSFNQTNKDSVYLQGDAFVSQGIQLTKNAINTEIAFSSGRVVYGQPLLLWDSHTGNLTDFTTHFSFLINTSYGPNFQTVFGDGLAFFLSPYPSVMPDNSSGGCLGLFSNSSALDASRNRIVAVEFDTYQNVDWDPASYHVGIDVNSIRSAAYAACSSSITDGHIANAWVSYNSTTRNLSVALKYYNEMVRLWHVVDLMRILPEKAAIGFSAATGMATEIHEILSWDFSSSLTVSPMKNSTIVRNPRNDTSIVSSPKTDDTLVGKKNKIWLLVVLACAVGTVMVVSGIVWFSLWWKKGKRQARDEEEFDCDLSIDDEFEKGKGPKRFTFIELAAATNNFAEEGKLGEGGFGEVYKGFLNDEEVAVKKVSAGSKQGKKEYISEVKIISRLRHRNLVQLVGWCHRQAEFLLVYQFMPNGSLDSHLYNQGRFLPWPVRHRIALGLASALLYLHEEWDQCVVHRDIKPSNVMLDSAFNAKLGDFGLARFVDHEVGSQTTVLAGTPGYLAPESYDIGRATKESDVYSFGVVALEIACARKPMKSGKAKLVEWVWELYGKGMILKAADDRLEMDFEEDMERLMVVGLWCAYPDYNMRPSIRQAINVLNQEAPLPVLPPEMPVSTFIVPSMSKPSSMSSSVERSGSMNSKSSGFVANASSLSISSG